jgi:hypothetical protein
MNDAQSQTQRLLAQTMIAHLYRAIVLFLVLLAKYTN